MKTRIKVIEYNDGTKKYVPQFVEPDYFVSIIVLVIGIIALLIGYLAINKIDHGLLSISLLMFDTLLVSAFCILLPVAFKEIFEWIDLDYSYDLEEAKKTIDQKVRGYNAQKAIEYNSKIKRVIKIKHP
jgi:hypothetical protein